MYVGKGPSARAASHWKWFLRTGKAVNGNLRRWFERLKAEGVEPAWCFLEENVPLANWEARERYWIATWRKLNPALCNVVDGGNQWPIDASSLGGKIGGRIGNREGKAAGGRIGGPKGGRNCPREAAARGAHKRNELYGNPATPESCAAGGRKCFELYGSPWTPEGSAAGGRKCFELYGSPWTPEGSAAGGRRGGRVSCHNYWHVRRGIVNPNCQLCVNAAYRDEEDVVAFLESLSAAGLAAV
jgi:hypothetical protein